MLTILQHWITVHITGGFWRLCGMGGLACCSLDAVKHAGQPQGVDSPQVGLWVLGCGPCGKVLGPPAAITGFFTVRMVPWIMLRAVFSIFIN